MTQEFIDKLYAARDELYAEIEYADDHNNPFAIPGIQAKIKDLDSKIGIAQECYEKGWPWPFKDEYPEGCNESLEDGGSELKSATQWNVYYTDGSIAPTTKFYAMVDNAEFSNDIVRILPNDGDLPYWTMEDGVVDFDNLEAFYKPKPGPVELPQLTLYDENDTNEELNEDTVKKGNK